MVIRKKEMEKKDGGEKREAKLLYSFFDTIITFYPPRWEFFLQKKTFA